MSDSSKQANQSSSAAAAQPTASSTIVQAATPSSNTRNASATVRVQLFNASGATLSVPVVNKATGDTDLVFVQHGGKPKLLPGYTVDPVFANRNQALQVTKVTA